MAWKSWLGTCLDRCSSPQSDLREGTSQGLARRQGPLHILHAKHLRSIPPLNPLSRRCLDALPPITDFERTHGGVLANPSLAPSPYLSNKPIAIPRRGASIASLAFLISLNRVLVTNDP